MPWVDEGFNRYRIPRWLLRGSIPSFLHQVVKKRDREEVACLPLFMDDPKCPG